MKKKNAAILVSLMLAATLTACGEKSAVITPGANINMDGITAFDEDMMQYSNVPAESVDEPYIRTFTLYSVPEYEFAAEVINPGAPLIVEVKTTVPGWNFYSAEFSVLADGEEIITNSGIGETDICERVIMDADGNPVQSTSCETTTSMLLALNSVDSDLSESTITIRTPAAYTDDTGYEADEIMHEMAIAPTEKTEDDEEETEAIGELTGKSFVKIGGEWYLANVDSEVKEIPHGSNIYLSKDIEFTPFSEKANIKSIYKPMVALADKENLEKIKMPETVGITRTFDEDTNTLSVLVTPHIKSANETAAEVMADNYILLQWSDGTNLIVK